VQFQVASIDDCFLSPSVKMGMIEVIKWTSTVTTRPK
jgi:hypothetical protein